ncbi:mannose-1-phosphate guanylyltransferase [Candidatus Woesebacteria bacterium]|nr:mannose-1-phosphate guanylyltransferase [Candidatus Woesebacteria bacterium]
MKAVIFAGGVGTRLWPLSRKKKPKQFEKVIGDKSTLQLAVKKLQPEFTPEDIYISTGVQYVDMVKKQLPQIPTENIIAEPMKRDVGPAVALAIGYIGKQTPDEPIMILWSDHLVSEVNLFKKIIVQSSHFVEKKKDSIVFIGQTARFASDNLGWIEFGETVDMSEDVTFKSFKGFRYRPDAKTAETFYTSGHHCWNLGYFISTPRFILSLFEKHTPELYKTLQKILSFSSNHEFQKNLETHYNEMPEISFDNAILEKLDPSCSYVVVEDIGWSDVGAWEALKEALEQKREDNITKGKAMLQDSEDNLVYNYQDDKMVVGVGLSDTLIVNTDDILLVARKSDVKKIKKLVESFQGTENEYLT